jgi:hypothetical protein
VRRRTNSGSDSGPANQLNAARIARTNLLRSQVSIPSFKSGPASTRVVAYDSDAWEWGVGARIAPAFQTGTPGLTVHPMASYAYMTFDGGHDDRFEFGGQLRKALGRSVTSRGWWLGAEAAIAVLRTHIENVDDTESYNGWSATALAGVPVSDDRWGASIFGGAGVSYYGRSGINVRVGLDLQPWFLKR